MTFWDCLLQNLKLFGVVLWIVGTFVAICGGMVYIAVSVWGWVSLAAGVISLLFLMTMFTYMAQ